MEKLRPRIILKADDYGGDLGIRMAICKLLRKGVITDVAVMPQFIDELGRDLLNDAIEESQKRLLNEESVRTYPKIGRVLHVNFTADKPVSGGKVPSLVDDEGRFFCPPTLHDEYKSRGIVTADHCSAEYLNRFPTLEGSVRRFLRVLDSLKPGVTEFFFHPGDPDFTSIDPRYERGRVRDFKMLTHPKVIRRLSTVELTSYKEIQAQAA